MRLLIFLTILLFLSVEINGSRSTVYRQRYHMNPSPRFNLNNEEIKLPEQEVSLKVPEGESRAKEIAQENGFTYEGRIVEDYFKFKRSWEKENEPHNLRDAGLHFQELVPQKRVLKRPANLDPTDISDRGYENQWHLHGRTQWGSYYPVNLVVPEAWAQHATGKNVRIGIVDDGLDHDHKDIEPNYDAKCSHSFTKRGTEANDPMPGPDDKHGTACAGLAGGAADGSTCGVGVAYDATLCGLQLLPHGAMPTDADEAAAMIAHTDGAHMISVKSNSWGPPDTGRILGYVGPLTQRAIYNFTISGRNGLGGVITWAGGNGAQSRDQANLDGFCNSLYTICVSAVGNDGYVAYYSEPGFCILVTAPSSGADVALFSDYSSSSHNQCTNDMGGTSGACPQIAGLVALIIQANPRLTERDVRAILVESSQTRLDNEVRSATQAGLDPNGHHEFRAIKPLGTKTESEYGWIINGAGLAYSPLYGYGLPNASHCVDLAKHWTNLPPSDTYSTDINIPHSTMKLEANNIALYHVQVPISETLSVYNLEQVELDVSLDFGAHGSMRDIDHISLQSPDGTMSRLLYSNAHSRSSLDWTFMSEAHRGEHPSRS